MISYADKPTIIQRPIRVSKSKWRTPGRSHKVQDELAETYKVWQDRRARRATFQAAARITRAMSTAGLFNGHADLEWPIVWEENSCYVFHPPPDGLVDTDYVSDVDFNTGWVHYTAYTRGEGLHVWASSKCRFTHLGAVPTASELDEAFADDSHECELPCYVVSYHHGKDEEKVKGTAVAPATPNELQDTQFGVTSWLMDTGTPLDIVDEADIAEHAHLIREVEPILLDTANGEAKANQAIDLVVGLLGENILPYVLGSTPNALSIGRRCVDQDYGYVWPPGSLKPYFVCPRHREDDTTRRAVDEFWVELRTFMAKHRDLIDMRVEDYCPYLDDHGTTMTASLANHAAAACSVVRYPTATTSTTQHALAMPAPTSTSSSSSSSSLKVDAAVSSEAVATSGAEATTLQTGDTPDANATTLQEPNGEDTVPPPPCAHPAAREPRDLRAEAKSLRHLLTHTPYNPYCEACKVARMTRRPARTQHKEPEQKPKKFGDLGNADYIVAQSDESMGLTGERDALAIVDRGTDYTDCFPLMSRNSSDAYGALKEFYGDIVPARMYTDNAPELIRACTDLRWLHDKSTPHRHQSNAYCERSVRKIVEGARSLLEQAGLPSCFWPFAVRYWCLMYNTEVIDGDSPWLRRHEGAPFKGLRLPFGSLVTFMPKPETVKALPKFDPRGQRGIIVGCRLHSGAKWAKDYLVFPIRYFDDYDYSRPRNLLQLIPVTTQEVKPVEGETTFPLKANYDRYRNFPLSQLPACILRPAHDPTDDGAFPDKEDSEDVSDTGGNEQEDYVPPDVFADVVADKAAEEEAEADAEAEPEFTYRQDAIGRYYKYDRYGNRVYRKPHKGTLKPPSIPGSAWRGLKKADKKEIHDKWMELEAAQAELNALKARPPQETGDHVAGGRTGKTASTSAAARRTKCDSNGATNKSVLPMMTLMLTVMGTMCADAEEQAEIRMAVEECMARLASAPGAGGSGQLRTTLGGYPVIWRRP